MSKQYIKGSAVFTVVQDCFLKRFAHETELITDEDISSFKRSCNDVAVAQRVVDSLYVLSIVTMDTLPELIERDKKAAELSDDLVRVIKGA